MSCTSAGIRSEKTTSTKNALSNHFIIPPYGRERSSLHLGFLALGVGTVTNYTYGSPAESGTSQDDGGGSG